MRHEVFESLDIPGSDSHYMQLPSDGSVQVRVAGYS